MNRDPILRIGDIGDLGIQMQARVVLFEERRRHAFNDCVETALVCDEVIMITKSIGRQIIRGTAEDQGALERCVARFEVYFMLAFAQGHRDGLTPFPPVDSLCLHVISSWIPTSQSHAGLGVLVLQVLGEDDARLFIGNIGGSVILFKKVVVVIVAVFIES